MTDREPEQRQTEDRRTIPVDADKPRSADDARVDEMELESFPASDAPSTWAGSGG